jgi:predicted RNA-binding protein with RPS1 domain/predicted flap endonuclease-1-like 5' DNA nuclease
VEEDYKTGELVEAVVTRVTEFGAFVRLRSGVEGLLHVSEMADIRPDHPQSLVSPSDLLLLRVIRIEPQRRRIGLSLRQVSETEWAEWAASYREKHAVPAEPEATAAEEEAQVPKMEAEATAEFEPEMEVVVEPQPEMEVVEASVFADEEVVSASDETSDEEAVLVENQGSGTVGEILYEEIAATEEITGASEGDVTGYGWGTENLATGVEYIEGIGPVYGQKLREAGILTPGDLLRQGATPQGRRDLAEQTGINGQLILRWVNHADLYRIPGVNDQYAELLEVAGVDTVVELATRNAANLHTRLEGVNQEKNVAPELPALSDVENWIEQAKQLSRVITY